MVESDGRTWKAPGSPPIHHYLEEHVIVAKSKPKKAKREETTEEFVQRINHKNGKPNGLKLRFVWMKRRHYS